MRKVSLGVLLPVRRAYKSGQKGGEQPCSAAGGKEMERGILGPTKKYRPPQMQGFHRKRGRDSPKAKDTVTEPKTNGYPDRKGQNTDKLRAMDRCAPPEYCRSAAQ